MSSGSHPAEQKGKNAILYAFSVFSISSIGHLRVIYEPIWTIPSPLEALATQILRGTPFVPIRLHPEELYRKKRDFMPFFGIFDIFKRPPPSHL